MWFGVCCLVLVASCPVFVFGCLLHVVCWLFMVCVVRCCSLFGVVCLCCVFVFSQCVIWLLAVCYFVVAVCGSLLFVNGLCLFRVSSCVLFDYVVCCLMLVV